MLTARVVQGLLGVMSTPSTPTATGAVLLALTYLARLAARPDLSVAMRLAVAFARELLDDFRVDARCFTIETQSCDLDQAADHALMWLRRDVRCRGALAWRSNEAADILQRAVASQSNP